MKTLTYKEYLIKNGDWLQKLHEKNTGSSNTIQYISLGKYIDYLVLTGTDDKELLRLLDIYRNKCYADFNGNNEYCYRDNHVINVEWILKNLSSGQKRN